MAGSKLSISVAMCTYNGSRFLPQQLASIAAQTRLPDEMVVCDDGSTDNTRKIIQPFSSSVSFPVRLIRNPENLGSTKNFEKAIGLCQGDLIALSDQDDIWLPEKLARQAEMMERDPELGGVFSDAELIDDNARPLGTRLWDGIRFAVDDRQRFRAGEEVAILVKGNVVTGATLMFRSGLKKPEFPPASRNWQHDGWIVWLIVFYSQLRMIDEPLIQYRIHAGQQLGTGSIIEPLPPTLRERLQKGKREEPGKQLARAMELKELEEWLATKKNPKNNAVLPSLRRTIRFYEDRGRPYKSRSAHIAAILRNAPNYPRFEYGSGWKCFVRDLVIACL